MQELKNIDADREWTKTQLDIAEKDMSDTKANLLKTQKEKDWLNKDSSEAQV